MIFNINNLHDEPSQAMQPRESFGERAENSSLILPEGVDPGASSLNAAGNTTASVG
jgi:hypothetical protein